MIESRFIETGITENPGGSLARIARKPGFDLIPAELDHLNATRRDDTQYGDLRTVFEEKFNPGVAVHDHVRDHSQRWVQTDERLSTIRDEGTDHCPKQ